MREREERMKENRQLSYCSFSAGYEVGVATVLLLCIQSYASSKEIAHRKDKQSPDCH